MIHKIIIPTPFAVGDVNAFLIKGDTLSLVDAGPKTPEAYEALKHGLKEAGYTFNDIEQVILTHHHPDHAGWIDAFDNAKIFGHTYNDLWLKRDEAFFRYHDEFYLERLIEEGVPEQYSRLGEKDETICCLMGERPLDQHNCRRRCATRTSGLDCAWKHLVMHKVTSFFGMKQTRAMIGGDLVLEKVSSNPLIEPPLDPSKGRPRSLLQYNESLKRLLRFACRYHLFWAR